MENCISAGVGYKFKLILAYSFIYLQLVNNVQQNLAENKLKPPKKIMKHLTHGNTTRTIHLIVEKRAKLLLHQETSRLSFKRTAG